MLLYNKTKNFNIKDFLMIHLTHNDLDALGSMLCIHTKYDIKNVYHTNYADFEYQVDNVLKDPDKVLIISDLSFAERPELLKKLLKNKDFVYLIDHHSYPEGFWDFFSENNFKKHIDTSMCAAKACYKILHLDNFYLKNLIDVIDIYDRWVKDSEKFETAQILNDWFWENSLSDIFEKILKNNYRLSDSFKTDAYNIEKRLEDNVNKAYEFNLVQKFGPVVFVLGTDVFNKIILKEMSKEQPVIINVLGNVLKVRILQDYFPEETLEKIRYEITGKITGHVCAYAYKFSGKTEDECRRVVEIILKYFNS